MLNQLPVEILLNILHYFGMKDLIQLALTNQFLHNLTQDFSIWKAFIDKYFPYLKENNQKRPYLLFIEEYRRLKNKYENRVYISNFQTFTTHIPIQEVLSALSGKPDVKHPFKHTLIALAESNGKNKEKLSRQAKSEALIIAAETGHTASVSRLLKCEPQVSMTCLQKAHVKAAVFGHLPIVKILEEIVPIPPTQKVKAIIQACEKNNLTILEHYNKYLLSKGKTFNRTFNNLQLDDFLTLLSYLIQVGKNDPAKALYDAAKKLIGTRNLERRATIHQMSISASMQHGNAQMLHYFLDNPLTKASFPFNLLLSCNHPNITLAIKDRFKNNIPQEIESALYRNNPKLLVKETETLLQLNKINNFHHRKYSVVFFEACKQNAVKLIEVMINKGFMPFYYKLIYRGLLHSIRFDNENITKLILTLYFKKISVSPLQKILKAAIFYRRFEVIDCCIQLFKKRFPASMREALFKIAKKPGYAALIPILRKNSGASLTIKKSIPQKTKLTLNQRFAPQFANHFKKTGSGKKTQKQTTLRAWLHARANHSHSILGDFRKRTARLLSR